MQNATSLCAGDMDKYFSESIILTWKKSWKLRTTLIHWKCIWIFSTRKQGTAWSPLYFGHLRTVERFEIPRSRGQLRKLWFSSKRCIKYFDVYRICVRFSTEPYQLWIHVNVSLCVVWNGIELHRRHRQRLGWHKTRAGAHDMFGRHYNKLEY